MSALARTESFPSSLHSLRSPLALSSLPQSVWRADALALNDGVWPTGFAALDAALPGGGWPRGAMVELLANEPGYSEWALVLPGLKACLLACLQPELGRTPFVVLVNPPHMPNYQALAAQGLPLAQVLCVRTSSHVATQGTAAQGSAAQGLWACEQALRCADVAAVLAWIPHAHNDALRRLHLAAAQSQVLLWAVRSAACAHSSSPAPLRLQLERVSPALSHVHVLKRKGPSLACAIAFEPLTPQLRALLKAPKRRHWMDLASKDATPTRSTPMDFTAAQTAFTTTATQMASPITATQMAGFPSNVFRLPPRSQNRPSTEPALNGNERAADGLACVLPLGPPKTGRVEHDHGLDCPSTSPTVSHLIAPAAYPARSRTPIERNTNRHQLASRQSIRDARLARSR